MAPARHAWAKALEQANTEAAGLWEASVYLPSDMPLLLGAAIAGDAFALAMARMIGQTANSVYRAPRKKPALCLCCPRAVRKGDAFAICVTVPRRDDPSHAMGSAICMHCMTDEQSTLTAKIVGAMRQHLMPDARAVGHVHDAPGRVQ